MTGLVRCINFEYLPARIHVLPADLETNLLFRLAAKTHLEPFKVAADLGRLSEETATRNLALAYAEGVIVGSPDDELTKLNQSGWFDWLMSHPDEFDHIRGICEFPANFVDEVPDDDPDRTT